jgi:hypothetical protein
MRHPLIVTYATLVIGLVAAAPAGAAAAGTDAAATQYRAPSASAVPLGEETPPQPQQQSQPSEAPVAVPIAEETPVAEAAPAESLPQVAGEEGELPFTGYAVITVLGLGLLALAGGLVLRRATGRRSETAGGSDGGSAPVG